MPTISRVFAYDLLTSINEEGFLSSVKNRLSGKKPQPQAAPTPAQAHPAVAAENPLHNVISEMIDVPVGESRVVLHMNNEELIKFYLQPDPAIRAKLVDYLITESRYSLLSSLLEDDGTDEKTVPIKPAAQKPAQKQDQRKEPTIDPKKLDQLHQKEPDPKQPEKPVLTKSVTVTSLEHGFKFSDIYKDAGSTHYSVLLNIPDALKKEYLSAQDKKPVLEKLLDPRYYVMTINNGAAKKIGKEVDSAADLDEKIALIDPNIIVNYPKKQTIKQAKDLWNSKHRDNADSVAQRARAKDASQDKDETSSTDETPASGLEQAASDKGSSESPDKLADLKKIYSEFPKLVQAGHANRDNLKDILSKMEPYLK